MNEDEILEVETDKPESEDLDLGFEDEVDSVEDTDQTEEATEENQTEEENQENIEAKEESKEDTPTIKVKFNHQEMDLPLDQAQEYIQKGMNYDKILGQLQEVQDNQGLQYLNDLSQKSGMSVDEMVSHWRQQEEQAEIDELVQKNIPPEYAKEMIENKKFREEQLRKEKEAAKENESQAMYKEFVQAYPYAKAEEIPPEVWDKVDAGVPLKYAYMEYENAKLQEKIKVKTQNETNKKRAPGLGVTSNGTAESVKEDDFLEGFNEDY
ncbi:hypothetical protein [Clostridium sp. LP20]|uniref:hypothetical protein n=1 Tax=Clostridium sp. LP20 TaxID=3418665 RepID=UPI003EE58661